MEIVNQRTQIPNMENCLNSQDSQPFLLLFGLFVEESHLESLSLCFHTLLEPQHLFIMDLQARWDVNSIVCQWNLDLLTLWQLQSESF